MFVLFLIFLSFSHNTEKVIYFLLLDRKRRKPSCEDETEVILRNRSESGKNVAKKIIYFLLKGPFQYNLISKRGGEGPGSANFSDKGKGGSQFLGKH